MKLAIVIIAKDEEKNVGKFLRALAVQSLINRDTLEVSLYLAANGCSDRTVQIANEVASEVLHSRGVKSHILDWTTPGKSRSWNRVVHETLPTSVNYIFAMDADIEFVDQSVLEAMFDQMLSQAELQVLSGFPIKDTARKTRPTIVDWFSMRISGLTRHSGSINGSLYLARSACLADIWLPDNTPGEDGFLNAMVRTRGFSQPPQPNVIAQMSEPTHYFESHSAMGFFAHEKRMIVGTMINRWIFEYLHTLRLSKSAGPHIKSLNCENPDWVEEIITERSVKSWLIPRAILFRRLITHDGLTAAYLLRLPILLAATLLTLPPALMANRALKKRGAAALW